MHLGVQELLIILAIIVLVLGPTQIPKLAKMIGKSTKNFKKGLAESDDDDDADKKAKED